MLSNLFNLSDPSSFVAMVFEKLVFSRILLLIVLQNFIWFNLILKFLHALYHVYPDLYFSIKLSYHWKGVESFTRSKNLESCAYCSKETSILKKEMVFKPMIYDKMKNKQTNKQTCRLKLLRISTRFWLTNMNS